MAPSTRPPVPLRRTPPPNDVQLCLGGVSVAIGSATGGELRYEAPFHVTTWIETPHKGIEVKVASDAVRRLDQAPGSVFFVPAGTEFWTRWRESSRWVQVAAQPYALQELLDEPAAERSGHPSPTLAAADPAIGALASLVRSEILTAAPDRLYLSSLATAWLARLRGDHLASQPRALDAAAPALRRVRDYIHAHLADDLSLQSLARVAGVSAEHLRRSFEASFGLTPFAYVRRERVRLAEALLARGRLSTTQVIGRVGFGSRGQLYRAFLEVNGRLPGQVRRFYRQLEPDRDAAGEDI